MGAIRRSAAMTLALVAGGMLALAALATLSACEREARPFGALGSAKTRAVASPARNPFNGNAWAVSEGKRLFTFYNCVGCHANGGGGMGPPLMDERWIYGSEDANVFRTIADGRPNGMPAFRGKIPQEQIWMLVGYVRSLSGRLPMDVLPSRSDHMRASTPENARRATMPAQERRR